MYKGEIKVQEDELVSVLSCAQDLEIKGLSEDNCNTEAKKPSQEAVKRPNTSISGSGQVTKKAKTVNSNSYEVPTSIIIAKKAMDVNETVDMIEYVPPSSYQLDMTKVKKETVPVTIDMDDVEHGGGVEYVGARQEMNLCVSTGFDLGKVFGGGVYGEEEDHFENGVNSSKTCPYCQKQFKKLSSLNQHLPVHTKEKNFECNFCNASYTRSSSLYSHMRQKHSSEPYQYKPDVE